MFQSKTGWLAVLVSILGVLTTADVLPLVSAFLTETVGARTAHTIGALLALIGTVIAKMSQAAPPAEGA
ncbi:MAG: hypothetical protein ACK5X3_17850 [Pseudomonadota bacterium]